MSENLFNSYHHTIPGEIPPLDTKATFGLVSPIDFQMASPNLLWNSGVYQTLTGATSAKLDKETDLPPVKEEAVHQSNKEPKNESGCILQ